MTTVTGVNKQAVDFVCRMANNGFYSLFFWTELDEILNKYEEYEADLAEAAVNELLQRMGCSAEFSGLPDAFAHAYQNDLRFWAGRYLLVDDSGQQHVLHVLRKNEGALMSVDGERLEDVKFKDGVLTMRNAKCSLELTMVPPFDPDATSKTPPSLDELDAPRCNGTLSVTSEEGAQKTMKVRGKVGCYTVEGVDFRHPGDPASAWKGSYKLASQEDAQWRDERFDLTVEGERIRATFDGKACDDVKYFNNTLSGQFGTREFTWRFLIGEDRIVRAAGFPKDQSGESFVGYRTSVGAPATAVLAERGEVSVGADRGVILDVAVTGNPYKMALTDNGKALWVDPNDVSTVDDSTITEGTLPAGLMLESCDAKVTIGGTKHDVREYCVTGAPDSRAAGEYTFTLKVNVAKDQNAAPASGDYEVKTVTYTILVHNYPGLTATDKDLPPVFIDQTYSQTIRANGGPAEHTWVFVKNDGEDFVDETIDGKRVAAFDQVFPSDWHYPLDASKALLKIKGTNGDLWIGTPDGQVAALPVTLQNPQHPYAFNLDLRPGQVNGHNIQMHPDSVRITIVFKSAEAEMGPYIGWGAGILGLATAFGGFLYFMFKRGVRTKDFLDRKSSGIDRINELKKLYTDAKGKMTGKQIKKTLDRFKEELVKNKDRDGRMDALAEARRTSEEARKAKRESIKAITRELKNKDLSNEVREAKRKELDRLVEEMERAREARDYFDDAIEAEENETDTTSESSSYEMQSH